MAPPGYTIVVDASVTGVRAAQLMEQMKSGGFMDEATRQATVQVVTYNPDNGMMALMTVTFTFGKGGNLEKSVNIAPLRLRQFNYKISTWNFAYGLQVAVIGIWITTLIFARIRHQYCRFMRARRFAADWRDMLSLYVVAPDQCTFWGVVDLLEDWFQAASVAALFGAYFVGYVDMSRSKRFYDFYEDIYSAANFFLPLRAGSEEDSVTPKWALPEDNGPMLTFSDDVTAIQLAISLERFFWFTQIGAIGLQLVKVIKSMNFHSRLSFVSDTFRKTMMDLVHFAFVLLCLNFANVMMLNISFGTHIQRASTLSDSQIFSMELIANGFYTSPIMDLILESDLVRSWLQWIVVLIIVYVMPVVLTWIVMNILLGIVMDGYTEVKEAFVEDNSDIFTDTINMGEAWAMVSWTRPQQPSPRCSDCSSWQSSRSPVHLAGPAGRGFRCTAWSAPDIFALTALEDHSAQSAPW